jgi:16S rRNA processing protein RimM
MYRVVGKVKDAHGLKGELHILLFAKEAAWLKKLKEIRLKPSEEGEAQVLHLKSVRLHKGGLLVITQELKTRTQAEGLKGHLFEIPLEFLTSEKGEAIYLNEILGFEVFDLATDPDGAQAVGKITGFSSNVAQDLLIIQTPTGNFEVPFVSAFVVRIDEAAKKIYMDIPQGLLGDLDGEADIHAEVECSDDDSEDETH